MSYAPMTKALVLLFATTFGIALGHYLVDTKFWQTTQLFGGLLNPPTPGLSRDCLPGELSFLTWIFHWSMIFDYCYIPKCMWRWGEEDCTGNKRWKHFTLLHMPAFAVNGIVMANHLHRDQIVLLKLLHPLCVFIGSIATFFGSYAVARANGWGNSSDISKERPAFVTSPKPAIKEGSTGRDWDFSYSLQSIFVGCLLGYASLYLTT